jgi:hypothetical protein
VATTIRTTQALLARLAAQPHVAGVVRYGQRPLPDEPAGPARAAAGGDPDLCVVVDQRPEGLESLHLHIGTLPVDLNLRTWPDLQAVERGQPLTPIDGAILAGEVLYDRDGDLAVRLRALAARQPLPPPPTDDDVAMVRFGQRHALDKVHAHQASDPVYARVMLESSVYWLLRHYFTVRRRRFGGERLALQYLARHEPVIWQDLQRFYATGDLAARLPIAEALTERILAPVGGAWRHGEVLAFATPGVAGAPTAGRLRQTAEQYLRMLLGDPP